PHHAVGVVAHRDDPVPFRDVGDVGITQVPVVRIATGHAVDRETVAGGADLLVDRGGQGAALVVEHGRDVGIAFQQAVAGQDGVAAVEGPDVAGAFGMQAGQPLQGQFSRPVVFQIAVLRVPDVGLQ